MSDSNQEHTFIKPAHPASFDKTFDTTMMEITETMPKYQRIFSNTIHRKSIARFSDILAATVGRPYAILFGAITSFAATLAIYLLAKSFGYSLSGFESIAAFAAGWTVGMIFDVASSRRIKEP